MANPGPYPMGPPMGGPMQPMGGPPMAGMMPRGPARQGTSRMVPVVVSAGLAIGVFCGLLFGLGTGTKEIAEQPKVSNNARSDDYTPETLANPNARGPDKNAAKAGSAAAAGAGSASAGSNAGSADTAGSNGSAAPAEKPVKLAVEITPDSVGQTAKVFVDDKEITGFATEIPLEPGTTKKKIKVTVKAPGYKDVVQETEAEGDAVTLKVELIKGRSTLASGNPATGGPAASGTTEPGSTAGSTGRSSGTTSGGNTGTGRSTGTKGTGKTGKGKGSGGLIDI